MIILAPVTLTQGEAISLRMTYRENNIGYDFTGWTGTWSIVQRDVTVISGTATLETDGDIVTAITAAQIAALAITDQFRGRTLSETYWAAALTDGTDSLNFRAAVTVLRGVDYSGATDTISTDGLTVDDGNTLLAE